MKKAIASVLFAVLCGVLPSGCSKTLVPDEILQLPKYASVYTQYSIWYSDPMEITSENMQTGTILPFGTEVKITGLNEDKVEFTAAGKKFRITLDENRLELMPEFIRRTFSTKNADELAPKASAGAFEKMRRGLVTEGMTKEEVLVACGRPSLSRTPFLSNDTWIYQIDSVKSKRVIFRKNQVIRVLEL